ncbi:MAG TPA: AMP-binding protein [Burkholderiales bacterium]|nr:AMP-binding protein [Burkholderiales bacterium]
MYRSEHPDVQIPDACVYEFVVERFGSYADRAALIDAASGRALTYAQLIDATERVAAALARRGFSRGDVFAVCSPNVPEYAIVLLAVNRLGGVATTMSPLYTAHEIARQLRETRAKCLFTVSGLAARCLEAAQGTQVEEIFALGDAPGTTAFEVLMEASRISTLPVARAADLAALPYSSGTSGVPKGVMLTNRNLVAQLLQADVMLPRRTEDVMLAVLPFFHIYGLMLILLQGLRNGVTLITMARFEFEPFLDCVQRYRINVAPLVPPIVLQLAKHPAVEQYDLSSLRQIMCGAAPLGEDVERECAQRIGCDVMQGFGMTEFAGATLSSAFGRTPEKRGSVGKVWPNMEARIVDLDTGNDLGPDARGELWMRGPNVMVGYFERPDASRDTLTPDGWLRTGDVAYVDEGGNFFIVDRVKELIKHNAYQIAPAELEAALLSHPAVADAAVIPAADKESGEVPKAFVVLKRPVELDTILEHVAAQVAPYKKIRHIEVLDAIPKSPSGKILRRLLVERERAARR